MGIEHNRLVHKLGRLIQNVWRSKLLNFDTPVLSGNPIQSVCKQPGRCLLKPLRSIIHQNFDFSLGKYLLPGNPSIYLISIRRQFWQDSPKLFQRADICAPHSPLEQYFDIHRARDKRELISSGLALKRYRPTPSI